MKKPRSSLNNRGRSNHAPSILVAIFSNQKTGDNRATIQATNAPKKAPATLAKTSTQSAQR